MGLQGCGMVLYDLPAIRSVAWCGLQGSGMVFYDLPAIRSVAWCGLQGSGMVFYDLPAIRSVAWWGCKVVGWCSTICPPSGRWPGGAARLWDGALRSARHQVGGLVWLQGCGMVLYDLPAIRSVAWCGCKVVGWCSTICPPSGRWPGVAARLWDGALRSARHQIGGPGGLQGCGGSRSFV